MKKRLIGLLVLFVVAALATSVAFAKKDSDKSKGNSSSKSKSEKVKELKDFEKPTQGKSNAVIHKEKIEKVSNGLKETAESEKSKGQQKKEEKTIEKKIGNPDVGEQESKKVKTREEVAEELEEVAEEVEEAEEKTSEAMEEVEEEGGFKKFLLGPDYKNLGQLRSSLVHNRNQIRKLTKLSVGVTDEETKTAIEDQLMLLTQERARIKTVITDNEEGFSVLGWAFRLINGYPKEDVDDEEEEALEEEIEEAITGDDEDGDGEGGEDEEGEGEEEGEEEEEETTEDETVTEGE